ncbi:MAG: CRISPR-associated endonuclease Cas1 [Propionibacteriaceae bacterium]|nr:CRISPR-associated endonuclease Cas1 [Propionibacteriaceae bacterium]
MLNQFTYCPRLFYLEWVNSEWSSSDDTAAGDFDHRAIAAPSGPLPDEDFKGIWPTTRAVTLSDAEWGITAVIDRVDFDGVAVPVDYKTGGAQRSGNAWPADRIQVLAQAALLEAAGYEVTHGELYYRKSHRRVDVAWDDEARRDLQRTIDAAKHVADQLQAPPPLEDSPKCPRCSLAGICLPDEHNLLAARRARPARRLVPTDPEQRPVYVLEQGAVIGVDGGRLVISQGSEQLESIRLIDVSQVNAYGNVQVTTQALRKLWAHGAPVLWLSRSGWLDGWSQGQPSKNVELRRAQLNAHVAGGLGHARPMISAKIRNQRTLLMRNHPEGVPKSDLDTLLALSKRCDHAEQRDQLMGFEGTAARLYFGHFGALIRDTEISATFAAHGRTRRPPRDPINAALSYAYALLTKDVVATCLGVGLDPYLGMLHGSRFGRPSLALDLAEEFRPLIAESTVLRAFNNGELSMRSFRQTASGTLFTENGKKAFIQAYERRMEDQLKHPVFGYAVSYRRTLEVQARILAAVLVGEMDRYVGVVTR